jgi:tRNA(Ile)-lysidine synthase TilS/MesJ
MNSTQIDNILEYPQGYSFNIDFIDKINENEPLVKDTIHFIKKYNLKQIILSLSCGIDSSAIAAILSWYRHKIDSEFKVYTATINYNLREESKYETKFAELYSETLGFQKYSTVVEGVKRKTDDTTCNRQEYEEISKNIRFKLYEDIKKNNDENLCVLLIHHANDLAENILNNIMKKGNILDLEVMKERCVKHNTTLYRPYLHRKKTLFTDFNKKYNIPYLKNTTPDWSKRGELREKVHPVLTNVYDSYEDSLLDLGKKSVALGSFVTEMIFNKIPINRLKYGLIIDINNINTYPYIFWEIYISNIFHSVNESAPSHNSINHLHTQLNKEQRYTSFLLKKGWTCIILENNLVLFRDEIIDKYNNCVPTIYNHIEFNYDISNPTITDFVNGTIIYKINRNHYTDPINKTHILKKHYNFSVSNNINKRLSFYNCDKNDLDLLIKYEI